MDVLKALGLRRRAESPAPSRRPALHPDDLASLRCRHCGSPRLKLSYRRRDGSDRDEAGEPGATFILRCAACEGFTTVSA